MSPLRRPCWRLLTLARLVVVAAAIGAALVLLVLTSARGWPRSPGRAGGPAAQVVSAIAAQRRQASPPAVTVSAWQGGPEAPPYGGKQLRLAWGTPPDHATQNGSCLRLDWPTSGPCGLM